jgi:hypothetical protein
LLNQRTIFFVPWVRIPFLPFYDLCKSNFSFIIFHLFTNRLFVKIILPSLVFFHLPYFLSTFLLPPFLHTPFIDITMKGVCMGKWSRKKPVVSPIRYEEGRVEDEEKGGQQIFDLLGFYIRFFN